MAMMQTVEVSNGAERSRWRAECFTLRTDFFQDCLLDGRIRSYHANMDRTSILDSLPIWS